MMIELACAAIVSLWIAVRSRRETSSSSRARLFARLAVVAAAGWIGEESCIRLYGFYSYASSWSVFLDKVPLAIVCIWPVVVLSSIDLARQLLTPSSSSLARAALVMVLVIADASLIEPIATRAGLWSWTEPGPFHVPIVGVLGWGFFAFGVALALDRSASPSPSSSPSSSTSALRAGLARAVAAGPLAAHALVLASWWLALRWLPRGAVDDDSALPLAAGAWLVSLALAGAALRARVVVARRDLLLRVPAAAFFFVLLAMYARDDGALIAYALAFAPPYLVLTARSR